MNVHLCWQLASAMAASPDSQRALRVHWQVQQSQGQPALDRAARHAAAAAASRAWFASCAGAATHRAQRQLLQADLLAVPLPRQLLHLAQRGLWPAAGFGGHEVRRC